MLDDLAAVDWAGLDHARGSAEDVPALLRALAAGDAEALTELYDTIWHEDRLFPATVAAVPFLIRILDAPAADTAGVLELLADLAEHRPAGPSRAEQVAALVGGVAVTGTTASGEVADIAAGLPTYRRLLTDHPEAGVRAAAAHLIGALGDLAALRRAAAGDDAESVRAAAVLALAAQGADTRDRLADPAPLVRLVAAMSTGEADPAVVRILERDAPDALPLIEQLPGHVGDPLSWVLDRLRQRGDLQVRLVTGWLRHPVAAVREGAAGAARKPLTSWPPAAALLAGPLAEAVADPVDRVRHAAGERLATTGSVVAGFADRLWEVVRHSGDSWALLALGRLRDRRVDTYLAERFATGQLGEARRVLKELGPWATACRDLLAGLIETAPEYHERISLIEAAVRAGTSPALLVPVLRRQLPGQPVLVIRSLGELGPAAADAVPELTALDPGANFWVRVSTARALWRITGDPARALELLRAGGRAWQEVELMGELGPVAAEFTAELPPLFGSDDRWQALQAAVAYWRITGDAAPVVPVLVADLSCSPRGLVALACLTEIGPAAAAAGPRLRAAVDAPRRQWTFGVDGDEVWQDEEWRAACAAAVQRIAG
ncbi:hypothetical protein BJY16_008787 [Actinoplanes octamycinicus]|uniref:HEAT repeat protein n=1 Tax=Actinoplanes octamycinicus TaxID=135948 RepID=A0A7W7H7J0_9ACTN|nr:hypothetical protein [Actinoplanes octamycinicus]MBB4745328.1 hypothetical protein [Actinoplanes octamycinicus]GIE62192.1 hypothetical protein Aoc01nite_75940 [Actinoplanes octamycinicus]